jgi:DNA-binding NtrC family response regulator
VWDTTQFAEGLMKKTKVLIVDDEAAQRWMLRAALMEWGYETVEPLTVRKP